MNLSIIADGYPYAELNDFVFVQQLCNEMTRQGHKITVIAPQSITKNFFRRIPKRPYKRIEKIEGGEIIIYCPAFLSIGKIGKKIGLLRNMRRNGISKIIKKLDPKPDAIYGHFWHNGFAGYKATKELGLPLFVATGESIISQGVKTQEERDFVDYLTGLIAVSTKNLNESRQRKLLNDKHYTIIPNAIDNSVFKTHEKTKCRTVLGFPTDSFIVAFVGGFIQRKGPDRVAAAIRQLNNPKIKSIFIGKSQDSTNITPECDGILYKGSVKHEKLPLYLNAADVFVLPTLNEGCCNAIIEAMACGLPIISSDRDFNHDILDETNAILIDPNNIDQIANAINRIYIDVNLRERMQKSSIKKAKDLTLSQRAGKIIDFLKSNISTSDN